MEEVKQGEVVLLGWRGSCYRRGSFNDNSGSGNEGFTFGLQSPLFIRTNKYSDLRSSSRRPLLGGKEEIEITPGFKSALFFIKIE